MNYEPRVQIVTVIVKGLDHGHIIVSSILCTIALRSFIIIWMHRQFILYLFLSFEVPGEILSELVL